MLHVNKEVASEARARVAESRLLADRQRTGAEPRGPGVTERLMGALEGSGPDSADRQPSTVKWTVRERQGDDLVDLAHIEVTIVTNVSSTALPTRGTARDSAEHVIPQVRLNHPVLL